MDRNLQDLLTHVRNEAKVDHIQLWELVVSIRRRFPQLDRTAVMNKTLDFVRIMLEDGFVPGRSLGRDFEPWPEKDVEDVMSKVEERWRALGRDPELGDVVWFDRPDRHLLP